MAAGVAAVLREMSFVEHLEELRPRLICFLVAKLKYAVVGCIVAGVRVDAERPISE